MACTTLLPSTQKTLQSTVVAASYTWYTGWMPAIAMDEAEATLKIANRVNLDIWPAVQVAACRTDVPDAPVDLNVGSPQQYCWQEDPGDDQMPNGDSSNTHLQLTYQYQWDSTTERWTQSSDATAFRELPERAMQWQFPGIFPTTGSFLPILGPAVVPWPTSTGLNAETPTSW